ncbi:FixH family protein [Mesobacillus foraminis]|uniref:FixH family protein n=1 Tax=Mesobacillus foraminis TaxID=279826 RepID=UPI001BE77EE3|nr:FixH family protein [Mesobacillus foraminis]MBT2758780.1 FixH family protein [Mesobacillus foraminis]
MKKLLVGICSFFIILTGCSQEQPKEAEIPELVEVTINISPNPVVSNEETTIEAHISQGKDKVNDADDVTFEIWRDGEKDHEKIEAKGIGKDGIYSISKTFEEPGKYFVIAHVNARDMHTMPQQDFTVK